MKMRMFILSVIAMGACGTLTAQQFRLKKVELAGDKVLVHYDLTDTVKNRHYTVNVYSSRDNFLSPLQKITGDAGLEVPPGLDRKIIWNAGEELGAAFQGKVGLEVRGRLYVPFVRFSGFEDYKVLKRGKPYMLTWTGGTRQNILNFELYKGDQKIWVQPPVANTGSHEFVIPTSVKPGKNYKFKITDTRNKDEVVHTGSFKIKRKVPLALKVVPLLAVAGVVYLLTDGNETSDIPDPYLPGDNDRD